LVAAARNQFPLKTEANAENEHPRLQQVQWSPRGNALVFVYKNDIYLRPSASSANTARVTNNGEPGVNFNGVPDWLYEGQWLQREISRLGGLKNLCAFRGNFEILESLLVLQRWLHAGLRQLQ
jgi:Dipeptidyl peptidase IV (DPP IV) N-terminal region